MDSVLIAATVARIVMSPPLERRRELNIVLARAKCAGGVTYDSTALDFNAQLVTALRIHSDQHSDGVARSIWG